MLNFLGIGAQKCGTTWLYFNLQHHPDIFIPDAKEVHFWDHHYDKGLTWYNSLFANKQQHQVAGEITPAYGILPSDTIAEIYQHYPDLSLIYIVRDPKARAWSSALMALGRAEMTIDEASDQWFIDHFHSAGSLARGDYTACLKRWLEYFPSQQLLLLHYEDIKTRPRDVLQVTASHLNVNPAFFDRRSDDRLQEKKNAGPGHPIRPSLMPVLEELYDTKWQEFQHYATRLHLAPETLVSNA